MTARNDVAELSAGKEKDSPQILILGENVQTEPELRGPLVRAGVAASFFIDGGKFQRKKGKQVAEPAVILFRHHPHDKSALIEIDKLRGQFPSSRVIVVTDTPHEEFIVECIKRGAFDCVSLSSGYRLPVAVTRALQSRACGTANGSGASNARLGDEHPAASEVQVSALRQHLDEHLEMICSALAQCPLPVLITDIDGVIEYVNPKACQTSGYSAEELIGVHSRILKSDEADDEVYRRLWATISEGGVWEGEFQNKRKNGELYWEEATIAPVRNNAGLVAYFVAVKREISPDKATRKDLVAAKEKAEQSERLKDAFIATMSHEIRTPLNIIMGYIDLIQFLTKPLLSPDKQMFFENIDRASKRLTRTIEEIVNISSIQSGVFTAKKEVIDIKALIDGKIAEFTHNAEEKNVALSAVYHGIIPYAYGDRYCITESIGNVIDNAVKYTDTGSVTVTVGRDAEKIVIEVADTGVGISKEYMPRLFQVFSQEVSGYTRPYDGIGLGLALTKQYLEVSDGTVDVQSVKGHGTTVTLRIPVSDQLPTRHRKTVSHKSEARKKAGERLAVLAVEDDIQSQRLIQFILEPHYDVLLAGDASVAWDLLEAHKVDMVLMDISLHGEEDGLELTRRIRRNAREKNIPIIALTAHASKIDRERCLDAGCSDYIAKPVRNFDLLRTLRKFF